MLLADMHEMRAPSPSSRIRVFVRKPRAKFRAVVLCIYHGGLAPLLSIHRHDMVRLVD